VMGDRLIEAYTGRGLVLINIDPTNLFGPGERFVNDAEAGLMVEGQRIARTLGCTVRYVHHVAKHVARDRVVDQYVGRGGAAFADNARFLHTLVRHGDVEDAEGQYPLPQLADAEKDAELKKAAAEGRVLRLHVTKLSWAARPMAPIWLVREGYRFDVIATEEQLSRQERVRRSQAEGQRRVVEYVRARLAEGVKLSARQLAEDHLEALRLARAVARRAIHELLEKGHLRREPLPEAERQGARRDYLVPGVPLPDEEGAGF